MAAGQAHSGPGPAPAGAGPALDVWAAGRRRYVDNVKVLLIAAVIVGHAVVGYAGFTDAWSYSDVREVTLSPVTEAVLLPMLFLTAFAMPLLFLFAGLMAAASLLRKGPRAYARDRLLRLGVPFAVFAVALWPLLEYALFRWLGSAPALGDYLRAEGTLDTGVLWFVGALLAFSLAFAAWAGFRNRLRGAAGPGQGRGMPPTQVRAADLLRLAVGVAAATFLVRLVVPLEGDNPGIDLNVWEWPVCAGMFLLGVRASRLGWLAGVPAQLQVRCRWATVATVALIGLVVAGAGVAGVTQEQFAGGWHWAALAYAAGESALAVFGAVWVLGVAQRRLDRPFRWAGPAIARSAYGAFMLQGPVLIGLAIAARPLPFPAEVKAVGVAGGGVVGSFWLAWLVVRGRSRLARIL